MGDTELEAAARAVLWLWHKYDVAGMLEDGGHDQTAYNMRCAASRLAAALPPPPEPLKVGDTVTRDDADRVPVGAILRDKHGHAWEVWEDAGWHVAGHEYVVSVLNIEQWPMRLLDLPEPSDAEVGS